LVVSQNIKHLETGHRDTEEPFLNFPANVARFSPEFYSGFVNLTRGR